MKTKAKTTISWVHLASIQEQKASLLLPKISAIRLTTTERWCRIWGQSRETADRLFSPCPELAKTEYIQRHNTAATYLHSTICKHYV